jgi:hypothetical protein
MAGQNVLFIPGDVTLIKTQEGNIFRNLSTGCKLQLFKVLSIVYHKREIMH